jgi:hypothetical protein
MSLSLPLPASDLTECMFCICRQVCHENLRPHLPADASADHVQLITAMWDQSPRKRPSLAEILSVVAPSRQDESRESARDCQTDEILQSCLVVIS